MTARRLLAEFETIGAVLAGARPRLLRVVGDDPAAAQTVRLFRHALHLTLYSTVAAGPIVSGSDTLSAYLRVTMGHAPVETFRVLHLNAANRLLRDTVVATGTIDQVTVPVREVIARALELGSAAIILVHNHPSDVTEPSLSDIDLTRRIVQVAEQLDIVIHDHLIVGATGMFSFRQAGYLS